MSEQSKDASFCMECGSPVANANALGACENCGRPITGRGGASTPHDAEAGIVHDAWVEASYISTGGAACSPATREEAVRQIRLGEKAVQDTARELSLSDAEIRQWLIQGELDARRRAAFATALGNEVIRLRKENRSLRETMQRLAQEGLTALYQTAA